MLSKESFGERVLLLRKKSGASQQALADSLLVGKSAISMIENGQRGVSLEIAYALANYFDVSLDYLTGRSDNPNSHKA